MASEQCDLPHLSNSNRFFIIRHGESEANVANLIVSKADVGVPCYGLTIKGREQAKQACLKLEGMISSEANVPERLVIVSSDFKRARETAEILHDYFKPKTPLRLEPALRERNFGEFDMTDSSNYERIWEEDFNNAEHTLYSNESVTSVVSRTSTLIQSLDKERSSCIYLLVAHGDTLQILSTCFHGIPPSQHRTVASIVYVTNTWGGLVLDVKRIDQLSVQDVTITYHVCRYTCQYIAYNQNIHTCNFL